MVDCAVGSSSGQRVVRPGSSKQRGQRPEGVVRLAEAIYEQWKMPSGTLDNARLRVLADALVKAGCNDADLLEHLRGGWSHVRGCYVDDLLLNKG